MQQNAVLSKESLYCQIGKDFIASIKGLRVVLSQYVTTDIL